MSGGDALPVGGPVRIRHSVRGILLTDDHEILLCRHIAAAGQVVWVVPGGGIEKGETLLSALGRELMEEVGFAVEGRPPHVWHRQMLAVDHLPGYDGVIHDYFLVRTAAFDARGTMSDEELAAENITGLRWWPVPEIVGYRGPDLFAPRDLGMLLTELITTGVPAAPVSLGP